MYENLNINIGIFLLEVQNRDVQAIYGFKVVILGIDDPDECSNLSKNCIHVEGRIHKFELARKVPDLEVHEGAYTVNIDL